MGTNNKRGKRLLYGVGVNNVDAPTEWVENGKRVRDPYYAMWEGITRRCYSIKHQKQKGNSCYIGVIVHPDWHRFLKFKEWIDTQPQKDWRDLEIDKDLLVKGNRVY